MQGTKAKNFTEFRPWHEGHKLVLTTYRFLRAFPDEGQFSLRDEMKKAVVLGEEWMKYVYCEDEMKKELIDSSDIVVIFENIRCVVDAETEIVLGSLPFV